MRCVRRALGVAVLTAAGALVPAGAARAADPLELSLDGTTWSATLPSRLFASPAAAVPGDVITSALWVRNGSADPARVELEVADDLGVTPGTLAGGLSLTIDGSTAQGGTTWVGPELEPGTSVRIPLVVTYPASSELTSRLGVAAVLDSVTLVQTGAGPRPPEQPSVAPARSAPAVGVVARLAHTGADAVRDAGVAFATVVVGLLLLVARRRDRRAEERLR